MKFRVSPAWPRLSHDLYTLHRVPRHHRLPHTTAGAALFRRFHTARSSLNGGDASGHQGKFLLPGATMATILMLGILHARRLYDDKKVEDMKDKGIEQELSPDAKAAFLSLLPLRSISRFWGSIMNFLYLFVLSSIRPGLEHSIQVDRSALSTDIEEVALPLRDYASLQEFFVHSLKEGSRSIDPDPNCLVSPVDGKVLRLGELKGSRAMIEQVKGFSYSASSLLGTNSSLHEAASEVMADELSEQSDIKSSSKKSWWHVSFASPKVRNSGTRNPKKGIFYCVIYLYPGNYHRVHSPADWNVIYRRHFAGHLFPQNERAARTIRNLYVENERVVLEGCWKEGFLAIAAIGATNVGSIKLLIEPELITNRPRKLVQSEPPDERLYEPEGTGLMLKKGQEVAQFNMGSTVVIIFQAPKLNSPEKNECLEFKFSVRNGDTIRVGEPIGRWST